MNLIDKDALVAEIKRRINEYWDDSENTTGIYPYALEEVIKYLDTLKVKEVDSLTPEEIKKICTIYDNLKQERECATVLYNSDETFFNHVLMEYKSIAQNIK